MTIQEIDSKIYELRKQRDLYSKANFYHKVYEVNREINKLRSIKEKRAKLWKASLSR